MENYSENLALVLIGTFAFVGVMFFGALLFVKIESWLKVKSL